MYIYLLKEPYLLSEQDNRNYSDVYILIKGTISVVGARQSKQQEAQKEMINKQY